MTTKCKTKWLSIEKANEVKQSCVDMFGEETIQGLLLGARTYHRWKCVEHSSRYIGRVTTYDFAFEADAVIFALKFNEYLIEK